MARKPLQLKGLRTLLWRDSRGIPFLTVEKLPLTILAPFFPPRTHLKDPILFVDVSKHIAKAEEALRKKNFDFAVGFLQQVISLQPDHGEARRLYCRGQELSGLDVAPVRSDNHEEPHIAG